MVLHPAGRNMGLLTLRPVTHPHLCITLYLFLGVTTNTGRLESSANWSSLRRATPLWEISPRADGWEVYDHRCVVRGQLSGAHSLPPPRGVQDWTYIIRLGGKCLHLLSPLTALPSEPLLGALSGGSQSICNVQPTSPFLPGVFRWKLCKSFLLQLLTHICAASHICEFYTRKLLWSYLVFCLALHPQGSSICSLCQVFFIHIVIILGSHMSPFSSPRLPTPSGCFSSFPQTASPSFCFFIICIHHPLSLQFLRISSSSLVILFNYTAHT